MAISRLELDDEDVRRKAFELWEARGRPLGSPEQDWFTAVSLLESSRAGDLPLGLRFLNDTEKSAAPTRTPF